MSAISNWDDELTRYRQESVHQRGSVATHTEIAKTSLYTPHEITITEKALDDEEDDELDYDISTTRPLDSTVNSPLQSSRSGLPEQYNDDMGDDELDPEPLEIQEDQDSDWVELIGARDVKYHLYFNKITKETTHIPPEGFIGESTANILHQHEFMYPDDVTSFSQRLQFHVDAMNRHVDQALGVSTHMSKNATDALIVVRTALQTVQKCAQTSSQSVVEYLIKGNTDSIAWDFANSAAVDYYRACSTRTNHRELQTLELPQYFCSQPWIPSSSNEPNPTGGTGATPEYKLNFLIETDDKDKGKHRLAATTVSCSIENTADQLLALVISRVHKDTPPEEHHIKEYILKAVGSDEYFFGNTPLYSYELIRNSVQNQDHRIRATLMKRPEVTLNPQQLEKCQKLANDYMQLVKPNVELLERETFSDLLDVSSFEHESLSFLTYFPMYCITVPFHVRILGIQHLHIDTLPRYNPDMTHFYVKVVLFHGCVELPFTQSTSLAECGQAPVFNEMLYGDSLTMISTLPRETRIGFILYGKLSEKRTLLAGGNEKKTEQQDQDPDAAPKDVGDVPLAWVVNQLVDFQGELLAGRVEHRMWSFPKDGGKKGNRRRDTDLQWIFRATNLDNNSVQAHQAIVLHVEYPTFSVPVIAPLVPLYSEPNIKIVGRELVRILDQQQSALLLRAIDSDPLYELAPQSKQLLWNARHFLIDTPAALPKVLACVDWSNRDFCNEVYRMLPLWAVPSPLISAIELLDARYADFQVREYAVKLLTEMADDDLQLVLLQLVQCIKYEPYHDSPLSRFLIERAIANPVQIGHTFFWHLKAEVHDPQITERFTCILEELLSNIGPFVDDLYKQLTTVQKLQHVAECVVRYKREYEYSDDQTMEEYRKLLLDLNDNFFGPQGDFQVPLNPRSRAKKLLIDKCRYMSSKMVPLWLVFENADPQAPPIYLIFKSGDDLRQDILTLQILRIMDRLWAKHNLDMRLKPYNVIATGVNEQGEGVGMIEVVLNSDTTSSIQVKYGGGARGALKSDPIDLYLRAHNSADGALNKAVQTFVSSCAGYCVATFVLGIGDRHNGNIMVTQSGNLFHIDFGHFLGNFKKKFGVNRERAAFVFTPEMAFAMGGKDYKKSEGFKNFKLICSRSYKILRQHAGLLETLFILMVAAGMPELLHERDILYLRDKLCLDVDPKQAQKYLLDEIKRSLDSTSRRFDNYIHNLKHG